jgi:serine/threonine protein kinase
MALDSWRRVEQLYRAALERAPLERRSFLVEACQGDKDLVGEIESLLAQEAATQADASIWEATNAGPLNVGAQLGPYQIEAPIGAGGMGEVFRALDTRLRRTVAIKLLPRARVADAARRHRFLQEARTASALNHPNIVAIYDISSHEGADFLVMEYVHGQNLKDLIKGKELLLEHVVHIGLQVASALEAAHAAGIVHRDIKPANIMVTPSQVVKVLDFGIAKMTPLAAAIDETQTLDQATAAGVLVGTLAYMSPEQARGERVDGRSDIFSLGCVLYEAATRRRPFGGANSIAILQEIAAAVPAAPSSIRPGLPRAFDDLIATCLEKRATQRLVSATKLSEALASLSRGESMPAPKTDTRRSVAVVPFQFRTAASEDQFLSVALADAVANRLGSASKLVVRPTASVTKYAGKETEWMQVAQELNVEVVVEGSIQKMGPRVRVLI